MKMGMNNRQIIKYILPTCFVSEEKGIRMKWAPPWVGPKHRVHHSTQRLNTSASICSVLNHHKFDLPIHFPSMNNAVDLPILAGCAPHCHYCWWIWPLPRPNSGGPSLILPHEAFHGTVPAVCPDMAEGFNWSLQPIRKFQEHKNVQLTHMPWYAYIIWCVYIYILHDIYYYIYRYYIYIILYIYIYTSHL